MTTKVYHVFCHYLRKCTFFLSSAFHGSASFLEKDAAFQGGFLIPLRSSPVLPSLYKSYFTVLHYVRLPTWLCTPLKARTTSSVSINGLLFEHRSSDQQMLAKLPFSYVRYLWLFADGLHKNIITIRISEKRKLQNASSTQRSIQSYKDSSNMKCLIFW